MEAKTNLPFHIFEKKQFQAIGIELSGPYSALQEMGRLWGEFIQRMKEISGKVDNEVTLGITSDRPTDFTYYAAVEVLDGSNVPDGMTWIQIPTRTYAVFTHKGLVNQAEQTIINARAVIEDSKYKMEKDAYWLERYDSRFNPESESSEHEYYFPIVPR